MKASDTPSEATSALLMSMSIRRALAIAARTPRSTETWSVTSSAIASRACDCGFGNRASSPGRGARRARQRLGRDAPETAVGALRIVSGIARLPRTRPAERPTLVRRAREFLKTGRRRGRSAPSRPIAKAGRRRVGNRAARRGSRRLRALPAWTIDAFGGTRALDAIARRTGRGSATRRRIVPSPRFEPTPPHSCALANGHL
jgi:hypothetical protein